MTDVLVNRHSYGITVTHNAHDLGCLIDIDGPEWSRKDIDMTCRNAEWEYSLPGRKNPGEIKATIGFSPENTSYTTLEAAFDSGTVADLVLTFPLLSGESVAKTKTYKNAYVSKLGIKYPEDKLMACDVTFKLSGDQTT